MQFTQKIIFFTLIITNSFCMHTNLPYIFPYCVKIIYFIIKKLTKIWTLQAKFKFYVTNKFFLKPFLSWPIIILPCGTPPSHLKFFLPLHSFYCIFYIKQKKSELSNILIQEKFINTPYRLCLCTQLITIFNETIALLTARYIIYCEKIIKMPDASEKLLKALSAMAPYFPLICPNLIAFFQNLMIGLLEKHPQNAMKLFGQNEFFNIFKQAKGNNNTLMSAQHWACIPNRFNFSLEKSITKQLYKESIVMIINKYKCFTGYTANCPSMNFIKQGSSFENALWIGSMKSQCYTLTRIINKIDTLKSLKFAELCELLRIIQIKIQNPKFSLRKGQLMDGYITLLKYMTLNLQKIFHSLMMLPESKEKRGSFQLLFCYIQEIIKIMLNIHSFQEIGEIYMNKEKIFDLQISELKGYYQRFLSNISAKLFILRSNLLKQILKIYSKSIQQNCEKLLNSEKISENLAKIFQEITYFPKEEIEGLRKGREILIFCLVRKFIKVCLFFNILKKIEISKTDCKRK